MVLLRDDCERQREGDLLIAAEFADADAVNFMVTEARGLVCVALSTERCARARPRADRQPRQPLLARRLGDGLDRGQGGRHHRHLGRRPRPHDRRRGRPGERPRGPGPARPRLPAARPSRRHPRARRADRGGGRPDRGRRPARRRRPLPGDARGRPHGDATRTSRSSPPATASRSSTSPTWSSAAAPPQPDAAAKLVAETGRLMRDVMGHFATGVSVVTARDADGAPVGTTANAISSVSLDPPLLLACLAKHSETLAAIRDDRPLRGQHPRRRAAPPLRPLRQEGRRGPRPRGRLRRPRARRADPAGGAGDDRLRGRGDPPGGRPRDRRSATPSHLEHREPGSQAAALLPRLLLAADRSRRTNLPPDDRSAVDRSRVVLGIDDAAGAVAPGGGGAIERAAERGMRPTCSTSARMRSASPTAPRPRTSTTTPRRRSPRSSPPGR